MTTEPLSAAEISAWLRQNLPAGHSVLYVHPVDDDHDTMDFTTVHGGGVSEELMLAQRTPEGQDTRAAQTIYNARTLMVQLLTGALDAPVEYVGMGGIPLEELAPESRAAELALRGKPS